MKLKSIFGALIAATVMVGCTDGPTTTQVGNANVTAYEDAATAPFPFTKVGQKFEYAGTLEIGETKLPVTGTTEVTAIEGTKATVKDTWKTGDGAVTSESTTTHTKADGMWALKVNSGSHTEGGVTLTAESVTVPAGTFAATKWTVSPEAGTTGVMWVHETSGVVKQTFDFPANKFEGVDKASRLTLELKGISGQ